MIDRDALIGMWRRTDGAATTIPYPQEIAFRTHGIFEAARDPRGFTVWDVGTYRIDGESTIVLSTANDAEVAYAFSFDGDELRVRDDEGNELRYARVTSSDGATRA